MALKRDIVAVPFVGGVDTKSDAKTVLPSKLTALENGEFTKRGSVRKRRGYDSLKLQQADGSSFDTDPQVLLTRNDELAVLTKTGVYSLDNLKDKFWYRGRYWNTTHSTQEAAYTNAAQVNADCATNNDVTVYAWEDSRAANSLRWTVVNESTGMVYLSDASLAAANASRPYVVAAGTNILIFYADTAAAKIKVKVLYTADVSSSLDDAFVDLVSDLNASKKYCVIEAAGSVCLFYPSDGSVVTGSRLLKVNSVGVNQAVATVTADVATAVSIAYNTTALQLGVTWYVAAGDGFARRYNVSTLAPVAAAEDFGALTAVTRSSMAPVDDTSGGDFFVSCFEQEAASATDYWDYVVSLFPTFSSPTSVQHAYIAGSGFNDGTGPKLIFGHHSESGLQNTYYIYDYLAGNCTLVGAILPSLGLGHPSKDHVPYVRNLQIALPFKRQLETNDNNPQFAHTGIQRVNFDTTAVPSVAELGNTTYLSGSQLWAYDGVSSVESGFHMFPDIIGMTTTTPSAVAVGSFTPTSNGAKNLEDNKQYNYRVYYEWSTADGERMRSAAIPRYFVPDFAAGKGTLTIALPTLSFTQKHDDNTGTGIINRSDISIVVYRTEGDKSDLYYRCSSADPTTTAADNGFRYNNRGTLSVSFVDNMSDATLITQELDYQNSGELPNFAPLAPATLCVVRDRLFLAGGAHRKGQLSYSKEHFPGSPADFADGLTVEDGPDTADDIVAVSFVNNTPIVFQRRSIFGLTGDGPTSTGLDGAFSSQTITSDCGCVSANSIVSTPEGLLFKSAKGIYLLDQSLTPSYVGAEVEAYNEQDVTSSALLPNSNQVIFLTSSGKTLMYDYFYKQWSTWTNHTGKSAVLWDGTTYVYLRNDSDRIYIRNEDKYQDGSTGYKLKLRSAPLHLSDSIQGFWRLRKFLVIGEYKSPHFLRVGLLYNRDDSPSETFDWDPSTVIDPSIWGDEATWGDSPAWGGALGGKEYQFAHKPQRQKCQTIRFEFEDVPAEGTTPGASYEITEVLLEVGLREGPARLPSTRKF